MVYYYMIRILVISLKKGKLVNLLKLFISSCIIQAILNDILYHTSNSK